MPIKSTVVSSCRNKKRGHGKTEVFFIGHMGGFVELFAVKPSRIHFANSFDGGFST